MTTETTTSRRRILVAGSVLLCSRVSVAQQASVRDIVQPAASTGHAFMTRAAEMRRQAVDAGDQGYGAVVVRAGRIVGQSPSRVVIDRDPTAHAEMAAIRDAARRLGTGSLSGCVLYSTSRACPMCEAAVYWAGIDGMVHGEGLTDAGRPRLCRG